MIPRMTRRVAPLLLEREKDRVVDQGVLRVKQAKLSLLRKTVKTALFASFARDGIQDSD